MLPKPDESLKEAFLAWENQVAEQWTTMLHDPTFLRTMWQSVESTLAQQRAFSQMWLQNLETWELPTREKQAQIDAQIEAIRRALGMISEQVDGLLKAMEER